MTESDDKRKYIVLGAKGDPLAHHEDWIRETVQTLIHDHHDHLLDANIEIQWKRLNNPDPDGHVLLGKMCKTSERGRQLHGWDAILMLNDEYWETMDDEQRVALLDHELCHLALAVDKDGFPRSDGHGRKMYRIRKHDLEEFRDVVRRHGLWQTDIVHFVEAAHASPLFREQMAKNSIRESMTKLRESIPEGTKATIKVGDGEEVPLN